MYKFKLPFGLKNGKLIEINEVSSGLACQCFCPGCKEALIAKKGTKMTHHFSHKNGITCSSALETALHLKAKVILQNARQFMLPPVYLRNAPKPIFEAQLISYDKVIVEKKSGCIIPDLMLKIKNKWLLIEIAVNHFTGKEKIKSIRQQGNAAIEIDANAILRIFQKKQTFFQSHRFANHLLFSPRHKKWLFNPRQQQLEDQLSQTASSKDVKQRSFDEQKYYHVENCPQEKNMHQSGYKVGKYYANVFRDCLHCSYCIEIKYNKHFFGSKEVNGYPKGVVCRGI